MEIQYFDLEQGTPEWHAVRCGIATASELSKVLAKGEGKVRSKYMRQLVAESVTGRHTEGYSNGHMDRGREQEAAARELMEIRLGQPITQAGFYRNNNFRLGCSPDGLIGEDTGVELKSCIGDIQVERLQRLKKDPTYLPPEYRLQVMGSLLVTGRKEWIFASYSPGLPLFMVRATLPEETRNEIEAELLAFNKELDALTNEIKGMF